MQNREMAQYIQDFCDHIRGHGSLNRDDVFEQVQETMNKLKKHEDLNTDDKQCLNDLFFSVLIDSGVRWDLTTEDVHRFNAVRTQLGCFDLDYNHYDLNQYYENMRKIQDSKLYYNYDVGIICSVRSGADKEYIEEYIKMLESKGVRVFYPSRDTNQEDSGGIRICK